MINAFVKFYNDNKQGELTLTVDQKHKDLFSKINSLHSKGYPIHNLGFISRDKLSRIYNMHEFLIYPSLAESFGLGIIEAIENGCKVIGSDLPYLYEVCEPSLVFDPHQESSIYSAFHLALTTKLKPTQQKIHNQIDIFIHQISDSHEN